LTGYSSTTGTVAVTDTILQGIGKLNGNLAALTTTVNSSGTNLTTLTNLVGTPSSTGTGNALVKYTAAGGIVAPGMITCGQAPANKQWVLYDLATTVSDRLDYGRHDYWGFGCLAEETRYQLPNTNSTSAHAFYAATGAATSRTLMKLRGTGVVEIPGQVQAGALIATDGIQSNANITCNTGVLYAAGISTTGSLTAGSITSATLTTTGDIACLNANVTGHVSSDSIGTLNLTSGSITASAAVNLNSTAYVASTLTCDAAVNALNFKPSSSLASSGDRFSMDYCCSKTITGTWSFNSGAATFATTINVSRIGNHVVLSMTPFLVTIGGGGGVWQFGVSLPSWALPNAMYGSTVSQSMLVNSLAVFDGSNPCFDGVVLISLAGVLKFARATNNFNYGLSGLGYGAPITYIAA
jgi:hypothetical protein